MKKVLSVLLSITMLFGVLGSMSFSAYAKDSELDLQHQQFNSLNGDFNYSGKTFASCKYDWKKKKTTLTVSTAPNKSGKKIRVNGGYGVAIKGKYIYYADNKGLMRCKKNGKSKKRILKVKGINKTRALQFIIYKNRIYYKVIKHPVNNLTFTSSTLYSCSLTGTNVKKIAKNIKSAFYAYNNFLYYIDGNQLIKYNISNGNKTALCEDLGFIDAGLIGMENNKLYVFFRLDDVACYGYQGFFWYTIDVNANTYEFMDNVPEDEVGEYIHSAYVKNGKLYLSTGTGAGNGACIVSNGKLDYDSMYKYYPSGYSLTEGSGGICYYKNKTLMKFFKFESTKEKYKAVVLK